MPPFPSKWGGVRSPRGAQVGAGNRGDQELEQEGPRVLRKGPREGKMGKRWGGHAKQKGSRQVCGS